MNENIFILCQDNIAMFYGFNFKNLQFLDHCYIYIPNFINTSILNQEVHLET